MKKAWGFLGAMLAALRQTFIPQSTLLALGTGSFSSIIVMILLAVILSMFYGRRFRFVGFCRQLHQWVDSGLSGIRTDGRYPKHPDVLTGIPQEDSGLLDFAAFAADHLLAPLVTCARTEGSCPLNLQTCFLVG
jgi:hypothetical protein